MSNNKYLAERLFDDFWGDGFPTAPMWTGHDPVELRDGYLSIRAAKGLDKEEKDKKGTYIRQERYTGACSRSFYVGDVEPEEVSAKYEDGILKLTLPKKETKELPQHNRIAIQ